MFPRIRWFVLSVILVVITGLLAVDAFAGRGKGGRGGGKSSRGGGGASRSSGSRGGGHRSVGRSRGGQRSSGRSSPPGRSTGSRGRSPRSSGDRGVARRSHRGDRAHRGHDDHHDNHDRFRRHGRHDERRFRFDHYPYYFDYRTDYYLDLYLSLGCYHFGYDPACVYPAPPGYAAVVPDESVPFDDEWQLSGDELLALGEDAFYARDYKQAVRWLRHAAIELPENPKALMLLSQALFAVGDYNEAAGAAQAGMLVAEDAKQWGEIIGDYRRYYSDSQDYVDQLKALEKHVFEKAPDDRAARFLVAIQYGLLGYPKQSVRELDILLKSAPEDRLAREFRRRMAEQLGLTEPTPLPVGPEPPSAPEQETKGPSLPLLRDQATTPVRNSVALRSGTVPTATAGSLDALSSLTGV